MRLVSPQARVICETTTTLTVNLSMSTEQRARCMNAGDVEDPDVPGTFVATVRRSQRVDLGAVLTEPTDNATVEERRALADKFLAEYFHTLIENATRHTLDTVHRYVNAGRLGEIKLNKLITSTAIFSGL